MCRIPRIIGDTTIIEIDLEDLKIKMLEKGANVHEKDQIQG